MHARLSNVAAIAFRGALVLCGFFAAASLAVGETIDKPQKLSPKKLTQLLKDSAQEVFYGGVMVPTGDTLAGPIVVIAGALDIQNGGVLAGNAWIVNGRLILNGSARVIGRVDLVNSREYLSRQAEITGGVHYYACECRLDDEQFEQHGRLIFKKHENPRAIKTKLSLSAGEASRVDFDVIQVGLIRQNPRHKKPHVRGHALLHIPLRKNSRGFLGFDIDFALPLKGKRVDLLVHGFKKTYTNDDWQIPRGENGWILHLAGNDYADYYERQGGALGLRICPHEHIRVETVVSLQRDVSLRTKSAPSLFYPHRRLRDNPPIDEGERLAATGSFTYDPREDAARPGNAWFFACWIEKGIADGPGDFSYTAFSADLRRYTHLPLGLQWDMRARIFSAFDRLPRQVTQSLNGYGGIRGLDDDPFAVHRGDRLALLSGELRAGLPELPVFRWLFSRWDLVFFSDVGLLARARNEKSPLGFVEAPFRDWKKTVGIGISGESFLPYVGVYLAQDLDRGRRNPRVIVRIMRSF